jgi:hypothetical protein
MCRRRPDFSEGAQKAGVAEVVRGGHNWKVAGETETATEAVAARLQGGDG